MCIVREFKKERLGESQAEEAGSENLLVTLALTVTLPLRQRQC